jgi:hypothetical protein
VLGLTRTSLIKGAAPREVGLTSITASTADARPRCIHRVLRGERPVQQE